MPILFVIAGPNGIGKTMCSYDLLPATLQSLILMKFRKKFEIRP